MNRFRLLIALLIGVIVVAGIWYLTDRGEDRQTAVAERGSLDVTIRTVGTLQATSATAIRSIQQGVIDTLGVRTGDVVEQGDIIALLNMEPFDRNVQQAQRELDAAEFALQATEQQAQANADDPGLRLDVLNAADRVERATASLDQAIEARRQAVIVSPSAGTVIELSVRSGDGVGANQQIARIATADDLSVLADVDELDLPNVAIGAEARFRLDSFPSTEITGRVVNTAPQARQQGGATVFQTEIEFDPPADLDLRPGMNADVTIVTASREDVLLIPEAALRTVGDRSFVLVDTGSDTEEREVELGYRGNGQVEIVSGLADGDRVVLR